MMLPLSPIFLMSSSAACAAAVFTSVAKTSFAGVGSAVEPPKLTIVAPFLVSSS